MTRCGSLKGPPWCIRCSKNWTLAVNGLENGPSVEKWQSPYENARRAALTRTGVGHWSAERPEHRVLAVTRKERVSVIHAEVHCG